MVTFYEFSFFFTPKKVTFQPILGQIDVCRFAFLTLDPYSTQNSTQKNHIFTLILKTFNFAPQWPSNCAQILNLVIMIKALWDYCEKHY